MPECLDNALFRRIVNYNIAVITGRDKRVIVFKTFRIITEIVNIGFRQINSIKIFPKLPTDNTFQWFTVALECILSGINIAISRTVIVTKITCYQADASVATHCDYIIIIERFQNLFITNICDPAMQKEIFGLRMKNCCILVLMLFQKLFSFSICHTFLATAFTVFGIQRIIPVS